MSLLGQSYTVELVRSGRTLEIEAGQSLLHVLLDEGFDIDFSCESGICGTCVVPIVEGEVDHQDEFLTEEERTRMLCTCVSAAADAGPLRLDL